MYPVNQDCMTPDSVVPYINVDASFSTRTICPAVSCMLMVNAPVGDEDPDPCS